MQPIGISQLTFKCKQYCDPSKKKLQNLTDRLIFLSLSLYRLARYFLNFFLIYYLALKPRLGFLITFVQCLFFTVMPVWYRQRNNLPIFLNFIDTKL